MTQPPPWGTNQPPPNQPPPGQRPPAQPGQPGAYPQQYPPQQYPPQGYPQNYPPQNYPPQSYGPPGGYPPQGGYSPQAAFGPGGYPPAGAPTGPPPPGPGKKKSPVTLILIVVAAVVLLAAVGGIAMLLSKDNGTQPQVSITPSQPSVPTEEPTPQPTPEPSDPTPTGPSTDPTPGPTGDAIDLGNGIQVTPASGWEVGKTGQGVVQLTDGKSLFLGQAIQVAPTTNPAQLCEAWHKEVAKGSSGGKFADPKDVDLGTNKLKGATCVAQTTISNGQGSATVLLFSLVSVRQSDGITVLGTILFSREADTEQLNKDFTDMVNSMLKSQS